MKTEKRIIFAFLFYLMSFFLCASGLHSIDVSQNMVRFSYASIINAMNQGLDLRQAIVWEKDMTAFKTIQGYNDVYITGIWMIFAGGIVNLFGFFVLFEYKVRKWYGGKK